MTSLETVLSEVNDLTTRYESTKQQLEVDVLELKEEEAKDETMKMQQAAEADRREEERRRKEKEELEAAELEAARQAAEAERREEERRRKEKEEDEMNMRRKLEQDAKDEILLIGETEEMIHSRIGFSKYINTLFPEDETHMPIDPMSQVLYKTFLFLSLYDACTCDHFFCMYPPKKTQICT
jgi:septal ring factor EnvC (AmiA/AmiB activator)